MSTFQGAVLGQLHVSVYLDGGPLAGVDGRGHSEEPPLAGRHEKVVGVQDRRVGQQEVFQLYLLVLAPVNKGWRQNTVGGKKWAPGCENVS